MEVFSLVLAIIALIVAVINLTFVSYDKKTREAGLRAIGVADERQTDASRLLADTHNAIVKSQVTLVNRIEVLETRTSALASSMNPAQGRRI